MHTTQQLEGFVTNSARESYAPHNTAADTRKASDLFKALRADKTGTLKEAIQDIKEMIQLRTSLHQELTLDVERIKAETNNLINNELPEEERKSFMQRLIELDTLIVEEKLNAFRDIAKLKEELREHLKELRNQENKDNLLDSLMTEGGH